MMLIGSKAIRYWFPDFPREPKDTDYAVIEIPKWTPSEEMVGKIEYLVNPIMGKWKGVATPDMLYTLKISHLFWDINWEKHLWDATWLKEKGCKLDKLLFHQLYNYWNEFHGKNKRSDLKMTASEFFDNAVKCEYDHDWLHTLINPYPTFNKVLKDGAEVEVDEEKFNKLSEREKEDLLREEVYIMAYERMPNLDYRKAYGRMLQKFIILHAPIWEAIWIIENYKKVCMPKFNFIKYLNEKINERPDNIIKRSTGSLQQQA